MATVIVNGKEIEIGDDERLNAIQIAERAGHDIPHYCWHPGLSVVASCRMCLCETGKHDAKSGEISMMPKLVPACQTPVRDGTVIITDSEKIIAARAMVEEDLLINHPIDCPICDKAGECHLQDYHFEHGQGERRADLRPFTSRKRELGETVSLFVDRCVMCTRCVRFTREVTGTSELMVNGRGSTEEIDVFPGYPLANKLSGNVVDLCPVGALGDRDFLYQQRVWFMKKHDHVCAGCSSGCSITVEENQDHVYRLKPRENPHINQWWMCDDGRYGFHHLHDERRHREPRFRGRDNKSSDLKMVDIEWHKLPEQLNKTLSQASRIAAVFSPYLTVEEAYLLAKYVRSHDPQAQLVSGPVPREGEDETFPGGFEIHAEKCPNRRGVELVLCHFNDQSTSFEDFTEQLNTDPPEVVWVTGGYPKNWINEETAERFANVRSLIVQDLFDSPLWRMAQFQLPSAAFAEREGSYVNANERLQSFAWAVRPPVGVWTEGQLFWRLAEMPGLYSGYKVMQQIAGEILCFAPALGEVSSHGVDLRVNQLAAT